MLTDLLVLASARAGSSEEGDAALEVLRGGADVEVAEVGSPGDLHRALDRRAGRPLVVAGGDGSLHLLVAALHDRSELDDAPVGLVPLGTGNDLARGLGVPLDAAEAARAVLAGRPRRLDLLVDDAGGVVVNALHLGVGARAADDGAPAKPLLGALAYRLGALVAGVRTLGWKASVSVDDRLLGERDARTLLVAVGNGSSVGGGTPLLPDADPGDGLLDVLVVRATGPVARASYAAALRHGEHLERRDVLHARGRQVTVRIAGAPVNVDGELGDAVDRRTWWVEPGAWTLLSPSGR